MLFTIKGQICDFRQEIADPFGIALDSIDPGADSGCAHIDTVQFAQAFLQRSNTLAHCYRVGFEFLAQCHRDSILELCSPDLEDIPEFLALTRE